MGTINDDTSPCENWLDKLVEALGKYPQAVLAAPVMHIDEDGDKIYAKWFLGDANIPLKCISEDIQKDFFVPAVSGFCFLVSRFALEKIDFFDENYANSCEDVDICLKIQQQGWRMVVCHQSRVVHFGGKSRYLTNANTDIAKSHNILLEKWGFNLNKFNSIQPKTAAFCVAFNQEHFIKAWVENAALYADELIVLYSKYPWNYNKNARVTIKSDNTGKILEKLKKKFSNLNVIEDEWDNETEQRNMAITIAKKMGAEILLIVDTDEFYEPKQIKTALKWMIHNPADVWYMYHNQLIKKPNWAIITPDGLPKFQFAINLKTVRSLINKRNPEGNLRVNIPETICRCWHYSYVMSDQKMKEKLSSFAHTNEIIPNWFTEVWPNIKPGISSFHPVCPPGWQGISEISVPQYIGNLLTGLELNEKRESKLLRLHLGCGEKHIEGMINCEYRNTEAADIVMDCSRLTQFDDKSAELIFSHAFFEHLYRNQQKELLDECNRVLNDDGIIVFLGIPDFYVISNAYVNGEAGIVSKTFDLFHVYRYSHGNPEMAPDYWLQQLHKSLFDKEYVEFLLKQSNFNHYVIFNYCYPGEKIPLNLGFVAFKLHSDINIKKVDFEQILYPFSDNFNDINEVVSSIKDYFKG